MMLVFTRQVEDEIVIGEGIRVKVLEISRNSVKIGIVAPRHVGVHRAEVYEQLVRSNLAAAEAARTTDLSAPPLNPTAFAPSPTQCQNSSSAVSKPRDLLPIQHTEAQQ